MAAKGWMNQPWARRTMKIVRRVHLYTGLFLVPWVCLYGVTGYLFNHPSSFSDVDTGTLPAEAVTDVLEWTDFAGASAFAAELASRVLDAANERAETPLQLASAAVPSFSGRFTVRVTDDAASTSIRVTPERADGGAVHATWSRRAQVASTPDEVRFETRRRLGLGQDLRDRGEEAGRELASRLAAESADDVDDSREVQLRGAPRLSLQATDGEHTYDLTYDPLRDTLSGRLADQSPSPPTWRRYLLRLHTAHTYPDGGGPRWWWAILVDIMSFAMVAWGVSGLLMWWQIRALRRVGAVVLIACAVVATWLALGMHDAMTG